jgi:hypothetical protein
MMSGPRICLARGPRRVAASTASTAAATTAVALLAAGCSGSPPGLDHFPLQSGLHWVYDQTTEWESNTVDHETVELVSLGQDSQSGSPAWHRRSLSGVDYWLRADDSGVYRVATKSDVDDVPKPDPAPRYVLKAPLAVGSSWQATTTAYLLRRRQEFPPEIRHSHAPVMMNYAIAAVDQTVTTRAGRFDHCLQVRGTAQMKVFADPVVGWRDLPLIATEWYCPGVGLVRLVREEPANSTFLVGGKLTMELTQWP